MSDYWKKKLDELNGTTKSSPTSAGSSYWKDRMTELEKENERKKKAEEARAAFSRKTKQTEARAKSREESSTSKSVLEQALEHHSEVDDVPILDDATLKREQEKDKANSDGRTWFQKGALQDGVSVGNVAKTALGTRTDIAENVWTAILGTGEKLVDAFATVGAYQVQQQQMQAASSEIMFQGLTGATTEQILTKHQNFIDETKKGTADFIAKDL